MYSNYSVSVSNKSKDEFCLACCMGKSHGLQSYFIKHKFDKTGDSIT